MRDVLIFDHFYTRKIAINIFKGPVVINLIKSSIQIQFVTFRRGRPGTPIDVGTGSKPSTWFPPGDS